MMLRVAWAEFGTIILLKLANRINYATTIYHGYVPSAPKKQYLKRHLSDFTSFYIPKVFPS